jgi:hypothetical protein
MYDKINNKLSKIVDIVFKNKGMPPLEDAKKFLSELMEAIIKNKKLKCILTAPDNGIGFGKPFIVKGLDFIEQPIPKLSEQEKKLFNETKVRLSKKWENIEHIENN